MAEDQITLSRSAVIDSKTLFRYRLPFAVIIFALLIDGLLTHPVVDPHNILLTSQLVLVVMSYSVEPFLKQFTRNLRALPFILGVFDLLIVVNTVLLSNQEHPSLVVLFHIHILLASLLLDREPLRRLLLLSSLAFLIVFLLSHWHEDGIHWAEIWWRLPMMMIQMFTLTIVGYLGSTLVERIQTSQQFSEEVQERLANVELDHKAILEALPSGIMTFDADNRLLLINPIGMKLLNDFEPEAWLGQDISKIRMTLGPSFLPIERSRMNYRFETPLQTDKGERWFAGRHSPLEHNDGFLIVFQDVTEARRLRMEIQEKQQIERMGRIAANMAHEIKNPLAGLMGSVQLLERGLDEGNESPAQNTQQDRILTIILKESARINRLVEDFLKYAQTRTPSFKDLYVHELLSEILTSSGNAAHNKAKMTVMCPPQTQIFTDADFFSQIMWNLLNNALDAAQMYSDSPQIEIQVHGTQDITIEVHDNGPGFDPKLIDKSKEPFFTTKAHGNGLGLAIIENLLRGMHAHMEISRSHVLGGACVSVIFGSRQLISESNELIEPQSQLEVNQQ